MPSFLILAALGVGAYLVFSSKTASASTAPSSAAAAQNAAGQAAALQAFNDQANSLGLTQQQAQMAYQLGMSPQDYATRLGM